MQCEMMKLKNKIKFQWPKKKMLKQKKVTKFICKFKVFCELVNNEFTDSFKFFIIVKPFLEFCLINSLKF
jgi:hypothetical protein